jgi:predicted kinase
VNKDQVIYLCVGMIASGKSTFARKRAKEGSIIVNHDDLTEMCHGEYRYEQGLRECYRRMEEALVREALRAGRSALVDRCHLAAESRRRWLDFANWIGLGSSVVAVAFPVEAPEVHARRRFEADPRGRSHEEWYMVAQHHFAQHLAEPLSESEGFAEIIRPKVNL